MGKRGQHDRKKGAKMWARTVRKSGEIERKWGETGGKKGGKEGEKRAKREQRRCHMGVKIMGKKWATCEVNWGNRGAKKVRES